MSSEVTLEQLKAVIDAFTRHDVDGIVDSFTDDGVFRNAKGPDVWGRSYTGKAEIRAFFEALFANSPNVEWRHTAEYICGDRVVTEWHRSATTTSGERQEWLGCDLYTFRAGKIIMKDTYIKVVG